MAKTGSQHITSGTISRESPTDVLRAVTKILRAEIQVRFYGGNDLMCGKIRPLSDDRSGSYSTCLINASTTGTATTTPRKLPAAAGSLRYAPREAA